MNTTEEKTKTTTQPQADEPKPPRKKLPRWAKILLGVAVVLLALGAMAALYVNGKLDLLQYDDGSISEVGSIDAGEDQDLDATGLVHNDEEMEMPEGSPFADEDVLNILLIGTDERTEAVNDADAFTHLNQLDGTEDTTEFSADARADTLILVSLNIKEDTIKLVSIERGTGVPILLDGYEGQYDWITHTFRYGGPKLTMDTVEDCFNIQVDHYVRVNFNSFVQIVDAVGGVDIEITDMEAKALNWEVPSNSMLIVDKVEPGLNHFDGYTALQYARLRKIDNDWKRIERQRTVIAAVLDQVRNASVADLDNLLNTVLPLVQTNFTKSEIAALLVQLPGFLGAEIEQLSMPLQGTYGVRTDMDDRLMYDPDWTVNVKALQDFLYNGESAEEVIAATPETAAAEEEQAEDKQDTGEDPAEEDSAWDRESDPAESYIRQNMHTVDLEYPLDTSDFGSSDYRLFMAGLGGGRNADVQGTLTQYLAGQGVRGLAVPDGAAAGILLDRYLQTGDTLALERYLLTHPAADRAKLRTMWQDLYAWYPGGLRAVGLGEDRSAAVVGYAVRDLTEQATGMADSEIYTVVDGMQDSNFRNVLYWFERGMKSAPEQMEAYFGDVYPLALRLYQGMTGAVDTGDAGDLVAYDLQQALETYPDDQILAFVDGEQSLQTEGSLAARMAQFLDEQDDAEETAEEDGSDASAWAPEAPEGVCSIGVLYGQWGFDTTFTADDPDTCWNSEALSSWLGEYITPGWDVLLALDGEDCPFDEGDALVAGDVPAEDVAQKLLILNENNIVYTGTPESAEAAS